VIGDGSVRINGIGTLEGAVEGQLSFLANSKYRRQLVNSNASRSSSAKPTATPPHGHASSRPTPILYFARVTAFFHPPPRIVPGVHPSAVVEAGSVVSATSCVGPLAYVGRNAVIGERCVIGKPRVDRRSGDRR